MAGAEDVRAVLAAERAAALKRISGLERDFRVVIDSAAAGGADDEHDPEGATIAFERQHVASLLKQAHDQLAEIDAARVRVADGSYGVCQSCGGLIGDARLAARPTAARCVRCAARR